MEHFLINYCSPTLAGLKVGNIFTLNKNKSSTLDFIKWNLTLYPLNIKVRILKESKENYLVYVYDKSLLESVLKNCDVINFLSTYGYCDFNVDKAIERLEYRLKKSSDFPHEIGVFLGYPLSDVKGFIKHKGQCYKKCGLWKVYGDTKVSERMFQDFHHCKNCFKKLYKEGYKTIDIINKFNGGDYEKNSCSLLVRNRQY